MSISHAPLIILLATLGLPLSGCVTPSEMHQMPPEESAAPDAPSYTVYTGSGEAGDLEAVVAAAEKCDVVFIGEEHGDPAAHHLELEIFRSLYTRLGARRLVLSLEMFERDVQPILDEYLSGLITERHFLRAARPWPRYETDYRPTLEFAREKGCRVIAANAPGRYVNRVARLGRRSLDDLPASARKWLPPLPYGEASAHYRKKFLDFWRQASHGHAPHPVPEAPATAAENPSPPAPAAGPDSAPDGFTMMLSAQSLWDAAMADAIAQALEGAPETHVVHLNGTFHSAGGLGIPEHLARYRPGTTVCIITILSDPGFPDFRPEFKKAGDWVIVTPSKRTGH